MSADNYIAVKKIKDRFAVWMEFASNDNPTPLKRSAKYFKTLEEAQNFANKWYSKEVVVEYGVVNLDDERQTAFLKTEKEADRKAIESAVEFIEEKEDNKCAIFEMNLHELMTVRRSIVVLRVCHGWLYKWGDSDPVFVPDNDSLMEVDE